MIAWIVSGTWLLSAGWLLVLLLVLVLVMLVASILHRCPIRTVFVNLPRRRFLVCSTCIRK